MSRLKYLVPNAITGASIAFSALAVETAIEGRFWDAAWWSLYCVLTDKLDGAAARRLHATSEFGLQLDSLADFFSFGIAPAVVFYAFFMRHPELGWATGAGRWGLRAIVFGYIACAAARLARFNVTTNSDAGAGPLYFGTPSTFAGGLAAALFAALLKYGPPEWTAGQESRFDPHLLAGLEAGRLMSFFPLALVGLGFTMVSTLRVPKYGRWKRRWVAVVAVSNIVLGGVVGWLRLLPEYIAIGALVYLAGSIWFHFTSPDAKAARLPPLFQ